MIESGVATYFWNFPQRREPVGVELCVDVLVSEDLHPESEQRHKGVVTQPGVTSLFGRGQSRAVAAAQQTHC